MGSYRSDSPSVQRRDFLWLAAKGLLALSGALGLVGILRYFSYRPGPVKPTRFELGPSSEYPPGSRTVVAEASAVLIHGPDGFQALSLICPHLGCTVEAAPAGFNCPCHGSRFGPDGAVRRGPATEPLRALRVEPAQDGRLVLFTD
jgi:nitrite reductase/ring-hydroxylating ferredoxin subunit